MDSSMKGGRGAAAAAGQQQYLGRLTLVVDKLAAGEYISDGKILHQPAHL
jgi:hypothetical protein